MAQLGQAQRDQLKALMKEFKRLQKELQAIHKNTGYEDLEHGVLALQIAEHAVEETLEHTGLSGAIQHKPNPKAHRQATHNGKRSSRICEYRAANFLRLIPAKI